MSSALSSFEAAGGKTWSIEALCEARPNRAEVLAALGRLGAPVASFDYLPPKDWVSESQRLHARSAPAAFIHGSISPQAAAGQPADPAGCRMAFGTTPRDHQGRLLALTGWREGAAVRPLLAAVVASSLWPWRPWGAGAGGGHYSPPSPGARTPTSMAGRWCAPCAAMASRPRRCAWAGRMT
jgi:hypothetical protein